MHRNHRSLLVAIATAAALSLSLGTAGAATGHGHGDSAKAAKPTVVLVHGAWADGSSWSQVAQQLQKAGYTVDVPPDTLRGVTTDAQNLNAYLKTIKGPIVLAGHSYAGMVITNAANGLSNVKALVYVDAFIPDKGDTVAKLSAAKPGSALAVKDPSTVFNSVPIPAGNGNVDLYVKPNLFPQDFLAGYDATKSAVLAASQRPLAAGALNEASGAPAWKNIPSWAVIGTADKIIPPAGQQDMAKRAGSQVTTVDAPHLSMLTNPDQVTKVITTASNS
ncbi:alpha/beta fold hydrolase [Streptomyces sp. NPDC059271]|uniref:alpha/beta fold hydrolase n=1 Tax=Streptomyces sp. NPDC059271 TaxID=3346799 RepID=UPI0036C03BB9